MGEGGGGVRKRERRSVQEVVALVSDPEPTGRVYISSTEHRTKPDVPNVLLLNIITPSGLASTIEREHQHRERERERERERGERERERERERENTTSLHPRQTGLQPHLPSVAVVDLDLFDEMRSSCCSRAVQSPLQQE